jgi:hypothetical protein
MYSGQKTFNLIRFVHGVNFICMYVIAIVGDFSAQKLVVFFKKPM